VIQFSDLPGFNAFMNGSAALLLMIGYLFIRRGRRDLHRLFMLAALACSALFLGSYLIYHYQVGSRPFTGQGPIRLVYFSILLTHTVLAAALLPLVGVTLYRALKKRFDRHRSIARWTFPIWLYVSVTGVVIYWMLYRL